MSTLIHPEHGPAGSFIGQVHSVAYHRNGVCGEGFWRVEFNEREGGTRLIAVVLEDRADSAVGAVCSFVINPTDADDAYRGDRFAVALRSVIAASKWQHELAQAGAK